MKRLAFVALLLCVGCSAQSTPPSANSSAASASSSATPAVGSPEMQQRIERQVRARFELPPDVEVKVGQPKPSDFTGYDAITVTISGHGKAQPVDFLLAKDGKTLARLTKIDLTKDPYAENMSKINLQDRPVRGNPNAKVTIVNFDDFECPFCSRMHSTLMTEILPQYGDRVRIIYKDFPLPMHPWAPHAANDANCLAKESPEAYWEFADYVHANQRSITGPDNNLVKSSNELDHITMDFGKKHGANADRLQACIKAQSDQAVKASTAEGDSLGVSATPTLFVNGQRLEGAMDADEVRAVLNQQLQAAGIQPPAAAPAPATPQAPPPPGQ